MAVAAVIKVFQMGALSAADEYAVKGTREIRRHRRSARVSISLATEKISIESRGAIECVDIASLTSYAAGRSRPL